MSDSQQLWSLCCQHFKDSPDGKIGIHFNLSVKEIKFIRKLKTLTLAMRIFIN